MILMLLFYYDAKKSCIFNIQFQSKIFFTQLFILFNKIIKKDLING